MNYLHKYHLVEAEKARVLGQFFEAEEFYERAIAGAAENEFIQEEALAYELAAKHYLARGREKIARTYMKEAHYCYDRWGAKAKVKDLEKRYPQLLNSNLIRQSTLTEGMISHSTAVMKAAQALSEIIHLDQLIARLLLMAQAAISLENARLYERLANYAKTLERKLEEQTQALQQEIINRERTEDALRQSEANYRNLLQTANSIIIRYDPQGRIHYINDYGVKLLGYKEHQILGRTLFETIIPDIEISGRDVKPMVHNLLRNPQSYPQGEGENLCRDGRRVWVAWSNQAIFNDRGEVVEILSVGNDTTQRRQAEEALQRSEAKFRNIFANSQVGIYRSRIGDGLILDANQRFADLFGFDSPQEMIGIEHTTGYWVNLSDRQQGIEVIKRDGEVRNYEAQMRKRDGTVFWGLSLLI